MISIKEYYIYVVKNWFPIFYILGMFGVYNSIETILGVGGVSQICFAGLYVFLLLKIVALFRSPIKFGDGFFYKTFMLFSLLSLSSVLSYRPLGSLYSVVLLFLDYMFAYWMVRNYSKDELRAIVLAAIGISLILAVPAGIANPMNIVWYDPADRANMLGFANIKGLFAHKIHAGVYLTIGLLFLVFSSSSKKFWGLLFAFLLLFLIVASGSSLAIVVLFVSLCGAFVISFIQRRFGWVVLSYFSIFLVLLVLAFVSLGLYSEVIKLLGRDEGMTGRVPVWTFALDYISRNYLLGGGFGVFFELDRYAPIYELWVRMPWYMPPSFHEGYLQLFAEAGIVGGGGFLILLFASFIRVLRAKDWVWVSVVLVIMIANVGASLFVNSRTFPFVLLVYIYYSFPKNRKNCNEFEK